ncbi:MAG TPA: hypothetical protein VK250_05690 [Nitrososphaeraceae archaeon]|jgi:hypothetical protein|nr:hypothetical protein [Nitrososphaeraceae archaeon]
MINKIRKNVNYVIIMNDRNYQKKKNIVEKFIKKNKTIDHSKILNEIDVDYDTLMRILSDLRSEGKVS